jgi:predicted MPP superfamily phosphohydrolase
MAETPMLTRRQFLGLGVGTAALGGGAYLYTRFIEPNQVSIERLSLKIPRLDPAFDGFKIVHISDLHIDEWMTEARLARALAPIHSEKPDVIAMTGDFVYRSDKTLSFALPEALLRLAAPEGVFAVLGNHDHWIDPDYVRRLLKQGGVQELRNSVQTIRRGDAHLQMAGVDDIWEEQDDLERVIDRLDETSVCILLAHEPDFADTSAPTGRFDLQLSGHSHGGQVRLPFLGAPVLPEFGKKYPHGLYQIANMYQYTNRGLGMLPPRVRLFCPPEITVITLRASTE